MTTNECAIEIKNFIEQTYECIFSGKIQVISLAENTFNLRLTLNSFYVPLNITMDGSIEEFLKYVKDEIRRRRLFVVEYYSGYTGEKPAYSKSTVILDIEKENVTIDNNEFPFVFDFKLS